MKILNQQPYQVLNQNIILQFIKRNETKYYYSHYLLVGCILQSYECAGGRTSSWDAAYPTIVHKITLLKLLKLRINVAS